MSNKVYLGIEFGSTRIKAVAIDDMHSPVLSGDYTWESEYINGIWTYSDGEIWRGLKASLAPFRGCEIGAAGISAMMHGYLVFDKDWNLLVPFRTWQNTITGQAAQELSTVFNFNIPQRWSIAHLYQAILNDEPHVKSIAHITTLAGYVHHTLTGVNAVGIGEASGIFPVDSRTLRYDSKMLEKFDKLIAGRSLGWHIKDIIPDVRLAGEPCGVLTEKGARILDGLLPVGVPFCPPEGDAETGMTATNAVAPRTGNVSAGTSIFSMIVLERPLKRVYPEVGIVMTPTGRPVAMVHCSNCTSDMNAWIGMLRETAELFGASADSGEVFTKLFAKALEGDSDCGGIAVCNYISGESVTHTDRGIPFVVRSQGGRFSLANFMRAQLFSTMTTLSMGMELLREEEIKIDSLTGHGGLFKTPSVGQRFLAAAFNAPVTCLKTAGEGGPFGMALLAAYMIRRGSGEALENYLADKVFSAAEATTLMPDSADMAGFKKYLEKFSACLAMERTAISVL